MEFDETRRVLRVVEYYLAGFPCDVVEIVIEQYGDGSLASPDGKSYVLASVVYRDDERFGPVGGDGSEQVSFRLRIGRDTVVVTEANGSTLSEYEIDEHGDRVDLFGSRPPTAGRRRSSDRSDWRYEVANGDTKLGYAEWLQHQQEAARTF